MKNKCDRCKKAAERPDHSCPYQREINENDEFECNCCEDCTENCALAI